MNKLRALLLGLVVALAPMWCAVPATGAPAPGPGSIQISGIINSGSSPGNLVQLPGMSGQSSCSLQVTGTWVGTLVFEATPDGVNYYSISATTPTFAAAVSSTTANGLFIANCSSLLKIRVRASAYTSGAATVLILATPGVPALSAGGGTASLTLPYSATTGGQTATTASVLGAAGVYNTTPPTATNGQVVPLQVTSNGYLATYLENSSATEVPHLLTSASATACTSIVTGGTTMWFIENENAATQTVTVTLYNEGSSPTCATADVRGTYVLAQGAIGIWAPIGKQFTNGVAYTLSAALPTGGGVEIGLSQ